MSMTVTVSPETRPAILDGRKCFVFTTMKSIHGGFVVEFKDGTLGEAVPGLHNLKFLDSKEKFGELCWEVDACARN